MLGNYRVAAQLALSSTVIYLHYSYNKGTNIIYRVMTTVYDNQNHWVLGLCPPSGILENSTHQ
jgi:hypothetical protein